MADQAFVERLQRLEKEVRIWRLAGLGLALLGLVAAAKPQVNAQEITASRITITADGKTRLRLQPDGVLLYYDDQLRATVGAERDSAAVMLYDGKAKPRMLIHVTGGKPAVEVLDADGKPAKTVIP
jgi:hypothetical protein